MHLSIQYHTTVLKLFSLDPMTTIMTRTFCHLLVNLVQCLIANMTRSFRHDIREVKVFQEMMRFGRMMPISYRKRSIFCVIQINLAISHIIIFPLQHFSRPPNSRNT
jgi:hypothetical protein